VHHLDDAEVLAVVAGTAGRRGGAALSARLYIAVKAPRPGLAKTRLAAAIGDEAALALYRAFLADLAARFCDGPVPLGWYVTPPDAWAELHTICRGGVDVRVLDQGEGDWTARQRRLFAGMAGRGETRTVLTASDSPHMRAEWVADAFRQLERHDVVLGPVEDGGYYLIGMRAPHDVLAGIAMSTATVAEQIATRCRMSGLSLGLVETTFDVDEVGDLPRLAEELERRPDCPATRAAVASLALPVT
jgi:rSAM/selenodomain-associated transferase 1